MKNLYESQQALSTPTKFTGGKEVKAKQTESLGEAK